MRRGWSTLILVVIAAAFGAYLYFIDAKKPVVDANAKPKVFTVDAADITRLDVKSASGDVTSLKKDASGWTIVKPIHAPADQNAAADVAASLSSLEQDRVVEDNASNLKTYGLDNPRIRVSFTAKDQTKDLLIGDKNATGAGLYAKLPSDNKVFLIPNSTETSLNRSTFDLRDKTALKFAPDKVDSVELATAKQTIRLTKSGDEWKLAKPVDAPADYTAVEGLIGQLQSAQMVALKEKPEDLADLKKYGLDKPALTATIATGSAATVLQIGSAADNGTLWARDPSKPAVFSLASTVADELRKAPADFRRKEIFNFRPFNTTKFEITRGKETRVFERVKGANGAPDTWKQTAPENKTVDASNFEGALLEISNLRADAFLDAAGPTTGLNAPVAIITATYDDGKKTETVKFGAIGPDVFAARAEQPGAMKLEMGKFDEVIKKLDSIK